MNPDTSRRRAAVTKTSNGTGAFLGWIVAELAGYGLLVASASDHQSFTCTGLCFTERELVIFLGLAFGICVLPAQLLLGLVLTAAFHRRGMSPPAAGTAAFFFTLAAVAVLVVAFLATQR